MQLISIVHFLVLLALAIVDIMMMGQLYANYVNIHAKPVPLAQPVLAVMLLCIVLLMALLIYVAA